MALSLAMGIFDWLGGGSDRGFDELYIEALERNPAVAKVERRDEDTLVVHRADGGDVHVVSLVNMRLEHEKRDPEERAPWIAALASAFGTMNKIPDDFEQVRDSILPTIRTSDLGCVAMLQMRAQQPRPGEPLEPHTWLGVPLCDGISQCFAYDQPHTMALIGEDQAKTWGVGAEELAKVGLENLRRLTHLEPRELAPGLYVSPFEDSYDSSRALLADWVRRAPVHGDHLVAFPTRDVLLIAGEAGAEMLLSAAEQIYQQEARPLSLRLYRPEPGGVLKPWEVAPDHPLRQGLRRAKVFDLACAYDGQKQLLDAVQEAEGVDIFVASFMMLQDQEGEIFSVSSWTNTVDTMLPETDRVSLVCLDPDKGDDQEPEVLMVDWKDVQEVAGGHLERDPTLTPTRWRVKTFPEGDQLAELRSRAV